jgi:hypothetical protein
MSININLHKVLRVMQQLEGHITIRYAEMSYFSFFFSFWHLTDLACIYTSFSAALSNCPYPTKSDVHASECARNALVHTTGILIDRLISTYFSYLAKTNTRSCGLSVMWGTSLLFKFSFLLWNNGCNMPPCRWLSVLITSLGKINVDVLTVWAQLCYSSYATDPWPSHGTLAPFYLRDGAQGSNP